VALGTRQLAEGHALADQLISGGNEVGEKTKRKWGRRCSRELGSRRPQRTTQRREKGAEEGGKEGPSKVLTCRARRRTSGRVSRRRSMMAEAVARTKAMLDRAARRTPLRSKRWDIRKKGPSAPKKERLGDGSTPPAVPTKTHTETSPHSRHVQVVG